VFLTYIFNWILFITGSRFYSTLTTRPKPWTNKCQISNNKPFFKQYFFHKNSQGASIYGWMSNLTGTFAELPGRTNGSSFARDCLWKWKETSSSLSLTMLADQYCEKNGMNSINHYSELVLRKSSGTSSNWRMLHPAWSLRWLTQSSFLCVTQWWSYANFDTLKFQLGSDAYGNKTCKRK